MIGRPVSWPRPNKVILLALFAVVFIVLGFSVPYQQFSKVPRLRDDSPQTCTPQAYSEGSWSYHPRTNATSMTNPDDALPFSGFEKCASTREYYWHLASNTPEQYDRFPRAQSWEWAPGKECRGLRELRAEAIVKDIVEDGGWYLVGDSVTDNHFFSLSCVLSPHIIAAPDPTPDGSWDRSYPQILYLNPSSPLVSTISFPVGFNITSTPLVIFRRIDLLYSKQELIDINKEIQPPNTSLDDGAPFSDEDVWTISIAEYLSEFLSTGRYSTLVVSTGGHWTKTLFSKTSPEGIEGVINLFEHAMGKWVAQVQTTLDEANNTSPRKRRAVIRPFLPGNEGCHDFRAPWTGGQPLASNLYNWGEIWRFNAIFEKLLASSQYPDIHYLSIDRPARLRPDAHTTGDCLHFMTGAGVLEGWTHYIWHYITRELS